MTMQPAQHNHVLTRAPSNKVKPAWQTEPTIKALIGGHGTVFGCNPALKQHLAGPRFPIETSQKQ
jgi:hypothetical protein